MSETKIDYSSIRVAGHGFRKVKGGYSVYRGFIPACECGEELLGWPTKISHGRELHAEHKKAVIKAARDSE